MAQAVSDNFTITGVTSVSFYISDDYFPDNRGGLSFEYEIVPGRLYQPRRALHCLG
jgi:hypothetical protein